MSTEEMHSVGLAIQERIGELPKISRLYCGKNLIAAVVTFELEPWLWMFGGRSGSHVEMMDEWLRTREDFVDSRDSALRHGAASGSSFVQKAQDAIQQIDATIALWEERHLPVLVPPTARRVNRATDFVDVVPCRRCRHDHRLHIGKNFQLSLVSPT